MLEYILRYNVEPFNWRLIFETNSKKIYTDVTKLMSPFSDFRETKKRAEVFTDPIISVYTYDGFSSIEYKGKKHIVDVTENYERLVFIIYELILISFEEVDVDFAVFHGALLSNGDDCFAIMAPTQSGKSSFSLNLSVEKYKYMSDDYVLFDTSTCKCTSFPKPIAIRNLDYIIATAGDQLLAINNEGIKVSLFVPARYVSICAPKTLKSVLFIERKECLRETFAVERLKPTSLYRKLLFSSHVMGNITINRKIVKTLQNIKGYNVYYKPGLEVFEKLNIDKLLMGNEYEKSVSS